MPLDPLDVLVEQALNALAQLLPGRVRRVRLENSRLGLDDLAERPEGDSLAVRQRTALSPGNQLRVGRDVVEELEYEAALADARHADERHELRRSVLARSGQCPD